MEFDRVWWESFKSRENTKGKEDYNNIDKGSLPQVVFLHFVVQGSASDAKPLRQIGRADAAVEQTAEHVSFVLFDGFIKAQGSLKECLDGLIGNAEGVAEYRFFRLTTMEIGRKIG